MGIIADLFGANKAAKAQEKAATQAIAASQEATNKTLALQQEQFDRIWSGTEIQRQAGDAATKKLAAIMGLNIPGADGQGQSATDWLRSTPGYDINFNEGMRSLNTKLAGQGRLQSGDAQREAIKFGQDYGDRIFNQERNALLTTAGLGQTALGAGASAGANAANQSSAAVQRNALNLGSSYGDIADAKSGFWGTVSGTLGQNSTIGKIANKFLMGA